MAESSHLVPNLNKMMKEYAEDEEEAFQETHSGTVHEGETSKARTEIKQPIKETRKGKRRAEEAETEQRHERVRDFILEKAFVLMEKVLKDRGFIFERGFNKLISPLIEILEKRGWQLLGEHKSPGLVALVKEFYVNMVGVKGKKVYVRGKWISFKGETINEMFNLKVQKDGSKFKILLKETEYQNIMDLLTSGKGKWKATRKTPHESISRGSLTEEAKVWFYFVSLVLLPSKHFSIVRKNEAILLYALLKGYKINVGKIIKN